MTLPMAALDTARRGDRVLWGMVAGATAVRLWFAWHFFGFLGGDDVEILQEAFKVATGLNYVPWNVRNLLLPDLLVAPVVRVGLWLGIHDTGHLAFVSTLPFVALASVNVVLVYRLASIWVGEITTARAAAVIYAFHWLPLAYGSTVYPRTATTTCVLLAALVLSGPARDTARGIGAGILLALAFAGRYSEGMYVLPLVVLCLTTGRGRAAARTRTLALLGGSAVAAAAAVGLSDVLAWGRPFASLSELWRMMVGGTGAEGLSTRPPWFYLLRLLFWMPATLIPALTFAWRKRRVRWAWAFLAVPVVLLSLVGHKELRYLQGAIPFLALLGGAGLVELARRWGRGPAAVLLVLTIAFEINGANGLARKSMAAVVAARHMAADPSVRVVALSQSWAYGGRLYLGNRVEVRDLSLPPSVSTLRAGIAGADRVGLYLSDLLSDPALAVTLTEHRFKEFERVEWGESKTVVVFARQVQR